MKDKLKIKGKSHQETLILIRDARVGGMNFVQIAERLGLETEAVFRAHITLMGKKLLGWKPEFIDKEIEVTDENTGEVTKEIEKEVEVVWFVPDQPEKKHRFRFNFKLNKKRGQTKKEVVSNGKDKS